MKSILIICGVLNLLPFFQTRCLSQITTDSLKGDDLYEHLIREQVIRDLTDTIYIANFYQSEGYVVTQNDSIAIVKASNNDKYEGLYLKTKKGVVNAVGSYRNEKKHGVWVYLFENKHYVIEEWEKGKLLTRKIFLSK